MPTEHDDQFLLPHEVARILWVSPRTVVRWAAMGRIPCVLTLGGHRRFCAQEVEAIALRMQGERDS